jgi:spore maturation protein CgeB
MARWGWCPSGRFFEAAACSTPLITDAWPGLNNFFDVDHEITIVATAKDVEKALARPDTELKHMATRARARTLEEHTGAVRAKQLIAYLEEAGSSGHQRLRTRTRSDQTEEVSR